MNNLLKLKNSNKLFDSRSLNEESIDKSSDPKYVINDSLDGDEFEEESSSHRINALSSTRYDFNTSSRRSLNMTKIGVANNNNSPGAKHVSDTDSDIEQFFTPGINRTMNVTRNTNENKQQRTPKFVPVPVVLDDSDSDKENGGSNKTKSFVKNSKKFASNQIDNKSYREQPAISSDDDDSIEVTFDQPQSRKSEANPSTSKKNAVGSSLYSAEDESIIVKPKSKKAFVSDSEDDDASVKIDNSVNQSLEESIQGL
jgi:hypothetical protein